MYKYLIFPLIILLTSCATPIKQEHYNNEYTEYSYPEASVFFGKHPSGSYSRDGIVLNELRKQKLFKSISPNNIYPEFRIDINYVKSVRENEAWYNTKFFMSVLTLLIVPAQLEYEYNLEFTVSYKGKPINTYAYYRKSDENMSIFNDRYEGDYIVVESIVSEFIKDILQDTRMTVFNNGRNIPTNGSNSI